MGNGIYSKNSIWRKILKIVLKISYQILIILCLILIAIIVLQKITNSNNSIAGYRIFRVITGSMLPQYDIGEVVICKEVDPKNIKVGEDIVYKGTYGEYNGKIIMHEVIKIDKDKNNNLNFHAKGLNTNSEEDPQIKPNQIYGVVKFKAGILTVLYNLATNVYTAFIIVFILALNVFISFKISKKETVNQLSESTSEENDIYETEMESDELVQKEENINEDEENEDEKEEEQLEANIEENLKNEIEKRLKRKDKNDKSD